MTGRTGFQKLLVLVLVGAFVIGAVAIMKLREVNPVSRLTSSVATFGYDESRSGQVISFLDASTASTLHAADPALGKVTKNAFRYMPLYIDGSQLGFGSLQNRRVLLAATQNGLQAIDVDEADVIWSVEVPDQHRIASTPVIDIETSDPSMHDWIPPAVSAIEPEISPVATPVVSDAGQ
ncbi:MAG: hypothetical protein JJ992_07770, partial [Planctomycetes bacterium]|nr:hypothetical protein [Planctomycetota bacterium]